jgi:ribonuclease HII
VSAIERTARAQYGELIVGVDEVGRGPLAGPVVACAIVMPTGARAIGGVDDSKKLAADERERLAPHIRRLAVAVGVAACSVSEVERLNIHHATVRAMRRAVARVDIQLHAQFGRPADHLLIDGKPLASFGRPHTAVVGGDARCYAIACASIVAKVTRDRLMRQLARRYPHYGWERNAGYGTAEHRAALARLGPSPHHRLSFCRAIPFASEFSGDHPLDLPPNA